MDQNILNSVISGMTVKEKSDLLERFIKFRAPVPDVETFFTDPYYLGDHISLYPHWMEKLKEVYPAPLITNPTIVAKGPIGGGKTYFGGMCMGLYDLAKLILMEDPAGYFGIDPKKGFAFKFFNIYKWKVENTVISPMMKILYESDIPFFNDYLYDFPYDINIGACKNLDDIISEDVYFAHLSELNFIDYYEAKDIIDQTYSRVYSRFQKGFGFFNHVVLDSSDTSDDSAVEDFIKNSPHARKEVCHVFSDPIWTIKKHLGIYFNTGSFKVYTGGSGTDPFIMSENTDLTDLDPDKILECPNELKPLAEGNIELFLNDQCGIGIQSSSIYIKDRGKILSSLSIPMETQEVYELDFFDETDNLMEKLLPAIESLIPRDVGIVVRLDLGVVQDLAGIAIGFQSEWRRKVVTPDESTHYGVYKVPLVVGLGRLPDQETCISKLENFFIELNQIRKIILLSTDQYQSTQLRQDLELAGIPTHYLSVDRTDYSYSILKRCLYDNRVSLPKSKRLENELKNLIWTGKKVDHPVNGSKDLTDALAGVVSDLYDMGPDASDAVPKEQLNDFAEIISHRFNPQKSKTRLW